jgi:uncharacterized SAM-binding protein YcdF (DUF218 family)
MTYFARHVVDVLATPLVAALLLSLLAALLRVRDRPRLAGALWACAGILVYVLSLVPVGDALLRPLEARYRPIAAAAVPAVHYVVVLGSSYAPRPDVSAAAALDCEGLVRVVEGVRLLRRLPGAHLILSGGAPAGREPVARGYAQLARELGVEEAAITVLDQPLNTDAEARAVAATVGSEPFLLVTSAWHMPRAMRLMDRARAHAVALPTGQQTGVPCGSYWSCLLPSSTGLRRTEWAIHEYLGLAALDLHLE